MPGSPKCESTLEPGFLSVSAHCCAGLIRAILQAVPRQASVRRNSILFFSTGDATRSRMAEGFFRAWSNSNIEPASTATSTVEIDPHAVPVMQEIGIDISALKSPTLKQSFRRHFICVVVMCEIPQFPPIRENWDVPARPRSKVHAEDAA